MSPEQKQFIASLDKDGTLTPEDLLEAARPKDSVIHNLFEWQDKVAASKFRLDQARRVISRVRVEVVVTVNEYRMPKYIRDPRVPAKEQGYATVRTLRTQKEAAQDALQREIAGVKGLVERTRAIADGLGLRAECEILLAGILATAADVEAVG